MAEIKDILEERGRTHGDFTQVAETAQAIKDTLHDAPNYAQDELSSVHYEALDMIASKLARIMCGNPNEPDHWRDIAGYALLVVSELEKGK